MILFTVYYAVDVLLIFRWRPLLTDRSVLYLSVMSIQVPLPVTYWDGLAKVRSVYYVTSRRYIASLGHVTTS